MSARNRRLGLVPLDGPTYTFPYGRVSKEEQHREGVSIPAQLDAMSRYTERIPGAVAVAEYVDIESGRKATRHHYQRLLLDVRAAIAERKRVVVVVWRVDRLGRNLGESIRVWDELAALGVEIHSVTEGGVLTPTHYRMFAWMAQEESDRIGARVSFAFEHFERNLWHKPGNPAWGYALRDATDDERRNGSPKRVLAPHDVEAPYVRELWQRYADGESIRRLAAWAGGLPDAARGGRNLGFAAVSKALRAPVYVGRLGAADEDLSTILARPRARWEPLVGDGTWERALAARETARRVPRQASGQYRLTGLLRCDRCGSRMSGRRKGTQGGTRAPRYEYICNAGVTLGASVGERRCLATIRADAIEEQVLDQVGRVLAYAGRSDGRADLAAAWGRLVADERVESASGRVSHLERQAASLGAEMTGALRKLNRDELTRDEYTEIRDALLVERTSVEDELTRLRGLVKPKPAPMSLEPLLASLGGWAAGLRSDDVPLVRGALAVLLTRVAPVRVRRGVYGVDLEWTPVGLWLLTVAAERSNDAGLVSVANRARARWSTLTFGAPTLGAAV
ncbi:MAG: recombinase family protein [Chloroflexota bacterium]